MPQTLRRSQELFREAQNLIAGGVSSDARRVSGTPLYFERGRGAHLWDVDGNRYVDYVLGQGPAILGHCPEAVVAAIKAQSERGLVYSAQHEDEVRLARLICDLVPAAEMVRFNSVGSEAIHGALRLARAYTGRSKVLKFEGHYHGWLDPVLYSVHPDLTQLGPGPYSAPVPGTRGQQLSSAEDLMVIPWNDLAAVEDAFAKYPGEIAAVVTEPILCNSGSIMPRPGYLQGLVDLAHGHGSLVIFDEIITGFRLAPGGAGEYFDVTPDLVTFGKAVAGGMQLSVLAGRREVMDLIARGDVAHAGTFNSHPLAVAGAIATLEVLSADPESTYTSLTELGEELMQGFREAAHGCGVPVLVEGPGPVFQTYFTDSTSVVDYRAFAATDRQKNLAMQALLAARGINVNTRGLWFMSTAHSERDVGETVDAFRDALLAL